MPVPLLHEPSFIFSRQRGHPRISVPPFPKNRNSSLGFAQAVQHEEEKHGDDGVDTGGNTETHREQRFGLREEQALDEDSDTLVEAEEDHGERKAGCGMFGVKPPTNGRSA